MKNLKSLITISIFLILISASMSITWEELSVEQQKSMLGVTQSVKPLKDSLNPFVASSTITPLTINDPFGAAGTPMLVEFELSNVGKEFPFNQISLPPDQFALVMAVDKDIGFRTTDGRTIDVLSKMTGIQKFMFLTGLGFEAGVSTIVQEGTGQQCQFINVYDNLPKSVQEKVTEENDGVTPQGVYSWDCLKLSTEPTFEERIQESCKEEAYSTKCLARINIRNANAVINTVVVSLVSDLPVGQCEQARGSTLTSFISKNVIKCGIGENGLQPGKSVKLRFVVTVPADTPVLSSENFRTSSEVIDGFTSSASCLKSQFPKSCHSLYAAVYPMASKNLFSTSVSNLKDIFSVGGCGVNKLYYGSRTDFEACVEARSTSVDVVGEPLYEAQGIFFILGPELDSQVRLIIFAFGAVGFAFVSNALRKRSGGS